MFKLIVSHVKFFNKLNPIQTGIPSLEQHTNGFHFVLLLIIFVTNHLYGIVWLHYQSTGTFNWSQISQSPYLFTHQLSKKAFWLEYDNAFTLNAIASLALYAHLIFFQNVEPKFALCQREEFGLFSIGTKQLDPFLSKRMFKFYRKIKAIMIINFIILVFVSLATEYYMVWINDVYTMALVESFTFWFILYPILKLYVNFVLFITIFSIIIYSGTVRIQQLNILNKFKLINKFMANSSCQQQTGNGKWLHYFNWWRFRSLNTELVHFCKQIQHYSQIIGPQISILLPLHIIIECYCLYITIFTSQKEKQHFIFGFIQLNMLLFEIIKQCAQVDSNNQKLQNELRKFCRYFFTFKNCKCCQYD